MKTQQLVETAASLFNAQVVSAEKILLEAYAAKDPERIAQAITHCKSVVQDGDDLMGCFDNSDESEMLCQTGCPFVHADCESLRVLVQFVTGRQHHPWTFNGANKFNQKVWEAHS